MSKQCLELEGIDLVVKPPDVEVTATDDDFADLLDLEDT